MELEIPPHGRHAGLRLFDLQRGPSVDESTFTAEVVSSGLVASARVYDCMGLEALEDLFAEMAREWRGWTGSKEWRSAEGHSRSRVPRTGSGT